MRQVRRTGSGDAEDAEVCLRSWKGKSPKETNRGAIRAGSHGCVGAGKETDQHSLGLEEADPLATLQLIKKGVALSLSKGATSQISNSTRTQETHKGVLRAHRSQFYYTALVNAFAQQAKEAKVVVGRCCFFAPLRTDLLSFCGALDFPHHLCTLVPAPQVQANMRIAVTVSDQHVALTSSI